MPKPVEQYEREATIVGGCLIHPAQAVARRIYQKRHGELTERELVCHTCDTPQCILDAHHFVASALANMLDKMAKGRWRGGAPQTLTDEEVRAIRASKAKAKDLAVWFGVSKRYVRDLRRPGSKRRLSA